ncbi:MAG: hypothetical protein FJ308_12480 [Planctomycetes bacterium]|nr:hypothetical protein [Planctomycetota bacterium]
MAVRTLQLLVLLVLFLVCCSSQYVFGEVVFSVAKVTPAPINQGTSAIFEVVARTKSGTQNFSAVGFNIALSRSDGAGGVFTTTSNNIGGFGWYVDYLKSPTEGFFDGVSGNGISQFTTTNTAIAAITVSTSGAVVSPGDYTLGLSEIHLDDGSTVITSSIEGPTSYSITAVPEPSAVLLASSCAVVGFLLRTRRRVFRFG